MTDSRNAGGREHVETAWDQSRTAGDRTSPAGTSGGSRGISGGNWLLFGAIAVVAIATGIVNGLSAAQEAARRGDSYDLGRLMFWEMSSIAVILLAVPILVLAIRCMRRVPGLAVRAAIGVLAIICFSAIHIAGMVAIRKLGLWLVGGSYAFNLSFATLLYEFRKDVVTCLLIGSAIWLAEGQREMRQAGTIEPAGPSPVGSSVPELIWLRDGTSRIRVAPQQILWVASAGNYVEYTLADGRQHLIRGTLATAEAELARFRILRVHRTRLANLDRVTGVEFKPSGDFELTFDNGRTLQGSRRYRAAVVALARDIPPA